MFLVDLNKNYHIESIMTSFEFTTILITILFSTASLIVSIIAYKTARATSKREEELHTQTITAALRGSLNESSDILTIQTTETDKILQGGFIVFPSVTGIEPMQLQPPENLIRFGNIKSNITKLLSDEVRRVNARGIVLPAKSALVLQFGLPVFMEYMTTSGGDAVMNISLGYIVFDAIIYPTSDSEVSPVKVDVHRFSTFIYGGRAVLPSFTLFTWPWERFISPQKVQERIDSRRHQQIEEGLLFEWEKSRPSREGGPLDNIKI